MSTDPHTHDLSLAARRQRLTMWSLTTAIMLIMSGLIMLGPGKAAIGLVVASMGLLTGVVGYAANTICVHVTGAKEEGNG